MSEQSSVEDIYMVDVTVYAHRLLLHVVVSFPNDQPVQLRMLCRLFSMFDDLATLHGVQKVETAGAVQCSSAKGPSLCCSLCMLPLCFLWLTPCENR